VLTINASIDTGIPFGKEGTFKLRRGSLNLILGADGHRKSSIARQIAYNAAIAGDRVLFIGFDSSETDIYQNFVRLHGADPLHFSRFGNSRLKDVVVASDYHARTGNRLVVHSPRERTLPDVTALISKLCLHQPLDMVVIDPISMLDFSTESHPNGLIRGASNTTAFQLKDFAVNLSHQMSNGGPTFLLPISGTWAGHMQAMDQGGAWAADSLSPEYSNWVHVADTILYVTAFLGPKEDATKLLVGVVNDDGSTETLSRSFWMEKESGRLLS
jgi:hypothetical protein